MAILFVPPIAMTGSDLEPANEHAIRLHLQGTPETVRPRLVAAVESLGYIVLNDEPLQAKHGSLGWGKMSANILDYPRMLTVLLRPAGERTTLAIFDYSFRGMPPIGAHETLGLEAQAIAALAMQNVRQASCAICGIESPAESKFCRHCGAPFTGPEPAEVALLQMTSLIRAAQQTLVPGAVLLVPLLIGLSLISILPLEEDQRTMIWFYFSVPMAFAGFVLTGFGLRRLFQSARVASELEPVHPATHLNIAGKRAVPSLSPVAPSVTEDTTELLDSIERQEAPAPSRSRDSV